jgi:hypothetical protein
LKIHVKDLYQSINLQVNTGIRSTWLNQSEEARIAKVDRARGKLLIYTLFKPSILTAYA